MTEKKTKRRKTVTVSDRAWQNYLKYKLYVLQTGKDINFVEFANLMLEREIPKK